MPEAAIADPASLEPKVIPLDINAEKLKVEAALAAKAGGEQNKEAAPSGNPFFDAFHAAMKPKEQVKEAVKEEIKTETKTETKTEEVKFTGKKAEDWKKVHARVQELETKATNLNKELADKVAELDTLKKQPHIDPKELETLKAERKAIEERLEVANLERSPRFEAHYNKLFTEATAAAKEAAGDAAERVEHLIALPPSKARKEALAAIIEELPTELDRVNLAAAVRQMDSARAERNDMLGKAKENLAKIREADAKKAEEDRLATKQRLELTAADSLKFAADLYAFKPVEGDEKHNAAIESRKAKVKAFFAGEMTAEEAAKIPALAQEATYLRESVVPALMEHNKRLQASIDALTKANPTLQGGGDPNKQGEKKGDFMSVFLREMQPK